MDGIEKDLEGTAEVIRIDLMSRIGREAARRYGVRAVPTVVALNSDNEIVYRHTGMPNRGEVLRRLAAP